SLAARLVGLPSLHRAIIPIALLDDLDAHTRWGNDPGHIVMQLLPEGVHFALLHQASGFDDHFRRDDIEHAALVFLAPAPPVPPRPPLAFDGPWRGCVRQFVVPRVVWRG